MISILILIGCMALCRVLIELFFSLAIDQDPWQHAVTSALAPLRFLADFVMWAALVPNSAREWVKAQLIFPCPHCEPRPAEEEMNQEAGQIVLIVDHVNGSFVVGEPIIGRGTETEAVIQTISTPDAMRRSRSVTGDHDV